MKQYKLTFYYLDEDPITLVSRERTDNDAIEWAKKQKDLRPLSPFCELIAIENLTRLISPEE